MSRHGLPLFMLACCLVPACGAPVRNIAPPRFRFDGGTGQGWQFDGVYVGGTVTSVLPYAGAAFWMDRSNAPGPLGTDPIDSAGSAGLPIDRDTARRLAQPSANGYYHIDLVSPPLQGWETFTRYQYQLLRGSTPGQVYGQLLLKVRKCDGSTTYLREMVGNQPRFCTVPSGQQWTACSTNLTWPSDVDQVSNIVVRVFFEHGGGYEGTVYLDDVGITPPGRFP